MRRSVFAVCDLEVEYALNFMDFLNRKKNIPFEIQAFTAVENLIDYGKPSDVLREVMEYYGTEKKTASDTFPVLKKDTEILGVYSPLGRCLKTSFALTLGQILAKNKAVLYLNLEEFSGFEELLGKGFAHTLSDLLYYVRQDNQNLLHKMNSMVQTINNLDYIPPVQMPADIRGITWQDWERLLQMIMHDSSYEVVVLDIGCGIDENFQLLDLCKRIYMPVLADTVSQCKIAQFENLVRIWDFPQILEKTVKISPPFHMISAPSASCIEQMVWSELGDYVRELLRKETE